MDFITATAPPVALSINGKPYQVPRFLLPQFKLWVAKRQQEVVKAACEKLGDDREKHAQFVLYYQHPPVDLASLMDEVKAPEGTEHVNETCLALAGVPEAERSAFHANVDPILQRNLAVELASNLNASQTLKTESGDPGAKGNPPTGQPHTSAGSPVTTDSTSPTSSAPTPDATPTA